MGLFRSRKSSDQDSSQASGSAPNAQSSQNPRESYRPPPGPPSSHRHEDYSPPLGPPPSYLSTGYKPPPGPPPHLTESFMPPPGPPPSHGQPAQIPPYHDWTSVPDNALLPPPPSLGHESSYTSNADGSDAERARSWCRKNPLSQPHRPTSAQRNAVADGDVALQQPPGHKGSIEPVGKGHFNLSTAAESQDLCFISSLPLYFEMTDSPFGTEKSKTIYFEIAIKSLHRFRDGTESSIAIGFCSIPYPTWRLPGWERGSVAVHTDDGHRYMYDNGGGIDFTEPIRAGETVGLGVKFSVPDSPNDFSPTPTQGQPLKGEVFFTRNGRETGGWDIQESIDETEKWRTEGVDGRFDLYGVVGTFGQVDFSVSFDRKHWLWNQRQ